MKTVVPVILKDILVYWKTLLILATPLVLLPLVLVLGSSEAKCAYVLLIMAVYWVTEAFPLAVTALIPIVLFPLLGIMKGKDVCSLYIADTSMTFLAGLMMALAIERVQLHRRIGTGILLKIGATPTRILIGVMLPTWFLSMWISNTATTSMMIPVTEAVSLQLNEGMRKARSKKSSVRDLERANSLRKLEETQDSIRIIENGVDASRLMSTSRFGVFRDVNLWYDGDQEEPQETYFGTETISRRIDEAALSTDMETEEIVNGEEHADESDPELEKKLKDFSKMLCLAVAYSSNVGGTATLTGSPPNLLVAEFVGQVFESHGESAPLTYATWLFFGLPHAVICFLFLWAWLQFYHLGWRSFRCGVADEFAQQEATIKKILRTEYDKLGPIKFGEVVTIILLVSMVFLWLARDPGFISGYASWFKKGYVTDAVPAIFIAIILFMCPSERPDWICFRRSPDEKARRVPALLDWNTVSTKLPWGPIILIGGGFALAEGCERSGLSKLIGEQMVGLSSLPTWVIAMITTTVIAFLTEITSNVAVIAVFLPILDGMAKDFGINPLYLMLPCGMAASYAFMLPIATPPNAIVFAYGHLKVLDMIKVGFLMNIICILVVTLGINTWGMAIFNVNELPWSTESTANFTTITPPGCN